MTWRLRKAPGSLTRVRPAEETVRLLMPLRQRFGITRVTDVTGLDVFGIPVHSVFRPRSTSMSSVHSGKGLTPADSLASGLAEAIERDCGERFEPAERIEGSYRELAAQGHPVVRFEAGVPGTGALPEDLPLQWVWVDDLARERARCLIPIEFVVQGKRRDNWRLFDARISQGLAAGNNLEEALCHAIAEIIENDALGSFAFRAKYLEEHVRLTYRTIDLRTLPASAQVLVDRIEAAGRRLVVIDGTSDVDVPVIFCVIETDLGPCVGTGACLNAEVAVTRAITEAVQTSTINIQGAREDLEDRDPKFYDHSVGFDTLRGRQLLGDRSLVGKRFDELRSLHCDYVDEELAELLARLRRAGVDHVYVRDVSDPELEELVVARVVIPALEDLRLDTIGRRRLRHAL